MREGGGAGTLRGPWAPRPDPAGSTPRTRRAPCIPGPPLLCPRAPEAAGRGGRAWLLRAVAQTPGNHAWAGPGPAGRPRPLPARVAQWLFPATEVLFSPTGGASFPTATVGRNCGYLLFFIKGNEQTRTHARNLSAPVNGCVRVFEAQSSASPSGGFGGWQLGGLECV